MPPISLPPWFLYDPAKEEWSGFWIVMLDALAGEMGSSFSVVPDPRFNYANPLRMVLLQEADVGFTDLADPIAFTSAMRMEEAVCTPGVVDSSFGALVLQTQKRPSLMDLFQPIGPGVWLTICVMLLVAAVAMTAVNVLVPPDPSSSSVTSLSAHEISKSFYHVVAALLNGEDYEWVTWPGRLLRLGLLFFTLVIIATYTANLAAFFTSPEFVTNGPQSLTELQSATVCVLNREYDEKVLPYVGSIVHGVLGENILGTYELAKAECFRKLVNREADAWIDDLHVLTSYRLSHCEELKLVPGISILKQQPGFCLSEANSTLAWQLSSALAYLKLQPSYQSLLRDYFGVGRSIRCDEDGDQDTVPVPPSSMYGLFIITGAFILLSCGMAVCFRVRMIVRTKAKCEGHNGVPTPTSTEGEMLRLLLQKVDDLLAGTQTC